MKFSIDTEDSSTSRTRAVEVKVVECESYGLPVVDAARDRDLGVVGAIVSLAFDHLGHVESPRTTLGSSCTLWNLVPGGSRLGKARIRSAAS